jgi:hypothetical protein
VTRGPGTPNFASDDYFGPVRSFIGSVAPSDEEKETILIYSAGFFSANRERFQLGQTPGFFELKSIYFLPVSFKFIPDYRDLVCCLYYFGVPRLAIHSRERYAYAGRLQ